MAVIAGRVVNDKKYFSNLFKLGALRRVDLVEALMQNDRWEMIVVTNQGVEIQVETARGEPKTFASLEAAKQFANSIGFQSIQISW